MFTDRGCRCLCFASKNTEERKKFHQPVRASLETCCSNWSFCSCCCSGDNFVVHCEARTVRKPSIRISIEHPQHTYGVSIRADVLAAECCLKRRSSFEAGAHFHTKKTSNIKEDTATLLLNPSNLSGLRCLMCLPYMCACTHKPSSVISHTLTHTRSDFFLIPVISGVTAVCLLSVSQLMTRTL